MVSCTLGLQVYKSVDLAITKPEGTGRKLVCFVCYRQYPHKPQVCLGGAWISDAAAPPSTVSHIKQRYDSCLKLESAAEHIWMSNNSFSNYFTQATSNSVNHFLIFARVSHSCNRLST